jgi:hypothetical protein
MTMATQDGFEVSFRIPLETCTALGWSLMHEAKARAESKQSSVAVLN